MTIRVKARFDGRVFVPDEPVSLPVNEPVTVEFQTQTGPETRAEIRERNEALVAFLSEPLNGKGLPDWALEREYMYEDRD